MNRGKVNVLINSDIPEKEWNHLYQKNRFSSPFQSSSFFNLFNSISGLRALAVAIEIENKIVGLAVITIQQEPGLKSYFSKRGIIYGGPLINTEISEDVDSLLHNISKYCYRNCIYIEIRNLYDYSQFHQNFLKFGWCYLPYMNYRVYTLDKRSILSGMSESRRRQIKKPIKDGVTWKKASETFEIETFYSILQNLYKYQIKKPLLPLEFFLQFIKRDLGQILVVIYENKIIGGILLALYENKILYEFYVCGSDLEYKEHFPSVMATWAALDYANTNGYEYFDFMGAGREDIEYGVRNFKARFGGEKVVHGRYLLIQKRLLYLFGRTYLKLRRLF